MFNAYPRWDRSMIVRVMSNGNGGQRVAKEQFVIANPKRVSVPKWTPKPLPDKQTDGDLAVTLTKLDSGVRPVSTAMGSPKDPMNKAVLAAFHMRAKWRRRHQLAADPDRNFRRLRQSRSKQQLEHQPRPANGDATMTYQWGLWPDQPWKLRVEMSQTAGFSNDELWSVTNLPVNPGSQQDM